VRARINGQIVPVTKEKLTKEQGLELAKELCGMRFKEFVEKKSLDFTFKLNDEYRFRVNLFFQIDGVSGVFRTIPAQIPTIDSLRLPSVVRKLCKEPRGLILVTGPTGSGKTTTLASIINEINHTQKKHIITVEDPVEFVYPDNQCIINQRAIGDDALDFSTALRAALREDPDIILVGEMRDLETIETAIHAAETGHLVLSTLHTVDAKETVGRVISMFPGNEQNRIRMSMASVLRGILSQRLVRTTDNKRTAAIEILVNTARIQGLIAEGREGEITDALIEGKEIYQTQSFDQALFDLYLEGRISKEEAIGNSSNPNDFKMLINNEEAKKGAGLEDDSDIFELKEQKH
jgi:twitching motility protein PilT